MRDLADRRLRKKCIWRFSTEFSSSWNRRRRRTLHDEACEHFAALEKDHEEIGIETVEGEAAEEFWLDMQEAKLASLLSLSTRRRRLVYDEA